MATYHFSNNPQPTIKGTNKKINSMTHFRYLSRDGSYNNGRQDLVYSETGNLPDWASSPKDFWKQAEENRRANGRSYREIRVALPEELTVEENKELVAKFLKEAHIKDDHVYTYVIHDKVAAFDPDHQNIHAHIMFNERKIEKDRPLESAPQFFSRHNPAKINPDGTIDKPITGGYAVDTWFAQRDTTIHLRKVWENLVNEALKEKGLDITVSCETLEKQQIKLEQEGKTQEAMFLNRPVAPRLMAGYKRPFVLKKIHEQIAFFKNAIDNNEAPEVSENNIIDLFARDVALRQKARQIQYEQKQAIKANIEMAEREKERSKKDDPMVVTVKNLRDVFTESHTNLITKLEKLTAQYENTKSDIISEKKLESAAMNILTDGKYQEAMDRYRQINLEYKKEQEKTEMYIHDKDKYNEQLQKMVSIRKERTNAWNETQGYKNKFLGTDRTALNNMIDKIKEYNSKKEEEAKSIYRSIKQTTKLLNASAHVLNSLKTLPDNFIAYSEKLPSVITMKNKLNGETRLSELPRVTYNGKVYIITDNKDPAHPKAIRLYDEADKGKATVYNLTREEKDGKVHTTSATPSDEKVNLYKIHEYKPKDKSEEKTTTQTTVRQPNTVMQNIANNMLTRELLHTARAPKLNIPEKEEETSIMTEAEKAVEKMYDNWNKGFAQQRMFKNRLRKVERINRKESPK